MSLKVLCPRCRAEVRDPADLHSVTCPACAAVFDGRSAPLAYWVGAAILCALVLVALWITAWQNRARKLQERYGEVISGPPEHPLLNLATERGRASIDEYFARAAKDRPAELAEVELPSDPSPDLLERVERAARKSGIRPRFFMGDAKRLTVRLAPNLELFIEHFNLQRIWGVDLAVRDARGTALAQFESLAPGDVRRWHELEMTCRKRTKEELVLDLELKPGSTCYGPGIYALKKGLKVDLPEDRSVSVLEYDDVKGEARLEVAAGIERKLVVMPSDEEGPTFARVHLKFRPLVSGGDGLSISTP